MPLHRIAIVNRGEPAMRFVNAVAELNCAGADRPTTIALYTEPDRQAWFVREADEAICIGPATVFDERAATRSTPIWTTSGSNGPWSRPGVDAAWPAGASSPSRPAFADLCDKLGSFSSAPRVTPCGWSVTRSDPNGWPRKRGSWSCRGAADVADVDEASAAAERIGYPLFVKATAGAAAAASGG